MNDLYIVSHWSKFETAWSGTPSRLRTALSKKLNLHYVSACKKSTTVYSILYTLTLGLICFPQIKRRINSSSIDNHAPVFLFGEYSSKHLPDTYAYLDLSYDYLLRLRRQHSPIEQYMLKKYIPTFVVNCKKKRADHFYRNCAGIFTMSEWLKKI